MTVSFTISYIFTLLIISWIKNASLTRQICCYVSRHGLCFSFKGKLHIRPNSLNAGICFFPLKCLSRDLCTVLEPECNRDASSSPALHASNASLLNMPESNQSVTSHDLALENALKSIEEENDPGKGSH